MVSILRYLFCCLIFVLVINKGFCQNPFILSNINETESESSLGGPVDYRPLSGAENFLELNGKSYFFAYHPRYGNELHQTDGTAAGTSVLLDINPGQEGVHCDGWMKVGNRIFFHLTQDEETFALWCTDGTAAGTILLKNHHSSVFAFMDHNSASLEDNYFFVVQGDNAGNGGTTLYRTDGTPAGTVPYFSAPTGIAYLMSFNNKLFFAASTDLQQADWKIWSGDGVNPPTVLHDFMPGEGSELPDVMENINEHYLLFATSYYKMDGSPGYGLFRLDPGAVTPQYIMEITGPVQPGPINVMDQPAVIGEKYFFCTDGAETPWVTDGTPGNTFQMVLASGSVEGAFPQFINIIDQELYMNATTTTGAEGVLKWDGKTARATELFPHGVLANIFKLKDKLFALGRLGEDTFVPDGTFVTSLTGTRVYRLFDPEKFLQGGQNNDHTLYQGKIIGAFQPRFWQAGWEPYLIEPDFKTWTGEISADWHQPDNWWPRGTPTATDNVLIAEAATYPVIGADAACYNLYLNFGAVTVNGGATLQVHNDLSNMGELSGAGTVALVNTAPAKVAGEGLFSAAQFLVQGKDLKVVEGMKDFSGAIDFLAPARVLNPDNWLRLRPSARFAHAGSTAFIDGPLIRQTTAPGPLDFPIGRNDIYRPVTITPLAAGEYTAQFRDHQPQVDLGAAVLAPLTGITNAPEYWQLAKTETSADAQVTFPLSPAIAAEQEASQLAMGQWNGSAWEPQTLKPAATGTEAGTFTTGVLSSFSFFAFGWSQQALPLTLLSFQAARTRQGVQLTWETAQEINTSHFEIERSTNGLDFDLIGTASAAGTAAAKRNYAFQDPGHLQRVVYYRLKMVDLDAAFTYSRMVALEAGLENKTLSVFPNPARSSLYIRDPGLTDKARVKIYDMAGRLLRDEEVEAQQLRGRPVNVNDLKPGSYLMQVLNKKELIQALFIKE